MRSLALLTVLMLAALPLSGCLGAGEVGFQTADLVAPALGTAPAVTIEVPEAEAPFSLAPTYALSWELSDVNQGHISTARVLLENKGMSPLFVYRIEWTWTGGRDFPLEVGEEISPGEEGELGKLLFRSDLEGSRGYSIGLGLMTADLAGERWYDHGVVYSEERSVDVIPLSNATSYAVEENPADPYSEINSLVDFEAVGGIVEEVREEVPGEYSLLQVVETYEWVRSNVEYHVEVGDHWQAANETLAIGHGDCEDHSILLASIVTALGGTARVNIIEQHAFPTVFVGNASEEVLSGVVGSYYGAEVEVCLLEDELGSWMVIDTNGIPYAGGLPPLSASTEEGWGFLSTSYLYTVDVTGEVDERWSLF